MCGLLCGLECKTCDGVTYPAFCMDRMAEPVYRRRIESSSKLRQLRSRESETNVEGGDTKVHDVLDVCNQIDKFAVRIFADFSYESCFSVGR